MELKIQTFLKKFGLEKAIKEFNLKTRDYGHKVLIKYDQLSSPTIMAMPEVQECRGLVLEKGTWRVMSMGFTKFFNSEEGNAHKIDWETAVILEKLDGTMIQSYYDDHDKVWYAGTTGTANGEGEVNNKMGTTFNQLFWNTIKDKYPTFRMEWLDKNCTYVFELTTPYNIVVKPHGESSATLLAARDNVTLKEATRSELVECGKALHLPVVKSYDLNTKNVGALLRTFETMSWSDEGYVICDAKFNRVKVKNPAYVAVHALKGKTAEYNIMEVVISNEIEEFGSVFPDRKQELLKLKKSYDELISKLNSIWLELGANKPKNISPQEKKKFATAVFEICAKYDIKKFTGLYFGLYEGKVSSIEEYVSNYDRKTLYKIL
jgi:hypothetical protein